MCVRARACQYVCVNARERQSARARKERGTLETNEADRSDIGGLGLQVVSGIGWIGVPGDWGCGFGVWSLGVGR
jgi:hypothetical protein